MGLESYWIFGVSQINASHFVASCNANQPPIFCISSEVYDYTVFVLEIWINIHK